MRKLQLTVVPNAAGDVEIFVSTNESHPDSLLVGVDISESAVACLGEESPVDIGGPRSPTKKTDRLFSLAGDKESVKAWRVSIEPILDGKGIR